MYTFKYGEVLDYIYSFMGSQKKLSFISLSHVVWTKLRVTQLKIKT